MKGFFLPLLFVLFHTGVFAQPALWGMASGGGAFKSGTIFSFDVNTTAVSVKFNFNDTNGRLPIAPLILAGNGLLYGATIIGSPNNIGVVFSFNPATDSQSVVFNFPGNFQQNGGFPEGTVLEVGDSALYGTTSSFGTYESGSLFTYNLHTDSFENIHFFEADSQGMAPSGPLIKASDGLLYGLTSNGGPQDSGSIFSYNITSDICTNLYNFKGGTDGLYPAGSLFQAQDGLLYGITLFGGASHLGTLFTYNIATRAETVIHAFDTAFGALGNCFPRPFGSLVQANSGVLFGLTTAGGFNNKGVIFSYNPSTSLYLDLHDFGLAGDGASPAGSLIFANNGLLYGTTAMGGSNNLGTIFSFDTTSLTESVLHSFDSIEGIQPRGALLEINSPESVKPVLELSALKIFPNPTTGQFTIQLPNPRGSYPTEIYNTLGQKIEQLTLSGAQNIINLSNQPAGIYFVDVQTENGRVGAKVVVER